MNPNTKDQEWKELQFRIDKLVGHFLKADIPAIEYKTGIPALLPPPPKYNEQNVEEISTKIWAKYYQLK
jgi:hypothetical protein